MTLTRTRLWKKMIELSPVCSGSLHEQYLTCGKAECRCHDRADPKPHGPYYLWVRRIDGKQVNRTLRPGADLERVREGIKNYHELRQLFSELVEQDEAGVLAAERAAEGKKNFKRRLPRR